MRLNKLAAFELPLIVAISPALLFPSPSRALVLLVVPILCLALRANGQPIVPATPLNAALAVLLVMVGVSLFATIDVVLSLGKISGVLLGVLLFWAISRWLTSADRLRVATGAFLLCGAVLAVVGLLGTNWDNKFPAIGALTARLPAAIRGVPGAERGFSTNAVAGCLVLFIPLQIALLTTRGRWLAPIGLASPGRAAVVFAVELALLALTGITLLFTESRTAWIGLVVGVAAFLLWYRPWTRRVAALGAAAIVLATMTLGSERTSDLIVSRAGPAFRSTFELRTTLWTIAVRALRDYKFTGMGMNVFRKLLPIQYPGYPMLPNEEVPHAHNHILQAGLDLGIPGLVAYLAIWLVTGALLVRIYRRSSSSTYRLIASGLGVGLIAHFMFGMADAIPLGAKVGVLFWLTLAYIVGLNRIAVPSVR